MRAPLYYEVHSLALDIVNASAADDKESMAGAYEVLADLCTRHENSEEDHPLQWEALGDFSNELELAVAAYEKGLACSIKMGLNEYSASIKLAMAEAFFEQDEISTAKELIVEAEHFAKNITDSELKAAINEFSSELGIT